MVAKSRLEQLPSALQAALADRRLLKVIAGLTNFDAASVERICRAAGQGGADLIDVACDPEMKRYGYDKKFALGCIAGSACLGMLIPPSVLMIVWGVLTEQAIGKIFIAGIIPGFILVFFYCAYIIGAAMLKPELVGAGTKLAQVQSDVEISDAEFRELLISTGLVFLLVGITLGGIWLGFFTPTEGAGVGAALALLLAMWKRMKAKELFEVILSVGRTSAPLLILLFCAQLYSRVLSMTGITGMAKEFFLTSGLGIWGVLAVMVLIWTAKLACCMRKVLPLTKSWW